MRLAGHIAVALLVTASAAHAYDPDTEWRTVHSPHFRVHYPVGLEAQAMDAARAAESALEILSLRLDWMPDTPIEIVMNDESDGANGFARSYPYNLIGINAVAPDDQSVLADYDDWLYLLLAHELTHVVHIDTVRGLPWVLNAIFGRVLVPNALQPLWFIEGLATYFETSLTSRGRLRSAFFEMMLRQHLLAGREMSLSEVSGVPWRWPQGTTSYLYGAHFIAYLVARFGEDTLREVSHRYGSELVPFAMNVAIRDATGHEYAELYADFLAYERERFEAQAAQVRAAGQMEGAPLTTRGQNIGGARLAEDGAIYFIEAPIGDHVSLQAIGPDGHERRVAWLNGGAELALLPGGREALVVMPEVVDTYRVYGDFFRVDLTSGALTRLSEGARAHGPDVSRDGARVVFAQNAGGHSVIRVAPLAALEQVETLADLGPATQVWTPRFAPDGQSVVFAGFASGQRDLYRVHLADRVVEKLTDDRAIEGAPSFSADGAWLLFHSERGGIYDLYARRLDGDALPRRLTRVIGGAFQPELSADGARLVYRSYGSEGFDLAVLDLPPLDTMPLAEIDDRPRPPAQPVVRLEAYPSADYSPLPSLRPRAWLPTIGVDAVGTTVGLALGGQDAVGEHTYVVAGWWGIESETGGFAAAYSNRQFRPGIDVYASRNVGFSSVPVERDGDEEYVEEEIWSGTVRLAWPLVRRLDGSLSLVTAYELRLREPFRPTAEERAGPRLPDAGRFSDIAVGLAMSNAKSYIGSISPEDGGSVELVARVEEPWLGSEFSSRVGTVALTGYLSNPWLARHVLAANLFAGWGTSSYARRRLFSISGLPTRDLVYDLLFGNFGAPQALRGFSLSPLTGNVIVEGHLEYRLPLLDVDHGADTLPFFVRALHFSPFVDAAAIAMEPEDLRREQHYSAGAEARLNLFLGYAIATTLRVGYGHGLGQDRDEQGFYLVLSGTF